MKTSDREKTAVPQPSVKPTFTFPSQPTVNAGPSSMASFSAYSGPIPLPDHLLQYEKMVPGIAKKFLE